MFNKHKDKIIKKHLSSCNHISFTEAVSFANTISKSDDNINDKILLLDYFLDIVKNDLKYELLADIIYKPCHEVRRLCSLFPYQAYDINNNSIDYYTHEEKIIDLSKDDILVLPWNRDRLINNIKHISKVLFKYSNTNHMSYYFTYIDLCYIYNGLHSSNAGMYFKKGTIKSRICKTELIFDHIYSDGDYWFNSHTNEEIDIVDDFRIAILFEIAKIKYNLERDER